MAVSALLVLLAGCGLVGLMVLIGAGIVFAIMAGQKRSDQP
jgi:hypothetical protein